MNILYAKCALYAYPNLDEIAMQIEEIVEKKALSSMVDYSPALTQCLKIVDLKLQKSLMGEFKELIKKALSFFSEDDLNYFDYKFFHNKPKEFFCDIDTSSRAYFRRQIKIVEQFAKRLEKQGITDKVFEEQFLTIEFFRELYRRVVEHEKLSYKNKKKSEKIKISDCKKLKKIA